jgi:hypothetical protein
MGIAWVASKSWLRACCQFVFTEIFAEWENDDAILHQHSCCLNGNACCTFFMLGYSHNKCHDSIKKRKIVLKCSENIHTNQPFPLQIDTAFNFWS